jgi:hypothetical protein
VREIIERGSNGLWRSGESFFAEKNGRRSGEITGGLSGEEHDIMAQTPQEK